MSDPSSAPITKLIDSSSDSTASYKDISWRLEVVTNTRAIRNIHQPQIVYRLRLKQPDGCDKDHFIKSDLVQLAVQNTGLSGKLLSSKFVPCVSRSLSTTLVNCNLAQDKGEAFVHNVFSNVADSYDKMNDLMSGGIHRLWKCYFIKTLDPLKSTHLLDVAGGTGDIAFRFLDHMKCKYPNDKSHKVTVCDINENMLEVGKKRAVKHGYDDSLIEWVHGDAQKLPFPDNSFDAYTISFGIRNVVNIDAALQESYRVLKPGGIFLCLEFSKVRTPVIADLYDWYSFNIIPVMGEVVAGDWRSYQYLVESIRKFPDQKDFADMIRSAGFHLVSYKNLTQGVAAIHMGYKKSEPASKKEQPPVELGTESKQEHSTS